MNEPKQMLVVLLFFLLNRGYAQTGTAASSALSYTSASFEFIRECQMYRCELSGQKSDSIPVVAPAGARFVIVELRPDAAIIRLVILQRRRLFKHGFTATTREDVLQYRYFLISRAQLDFKARPILASRVSFSIGNMVNTAKFRGRPFELSKEISLGPSAGLRFPLRASGGNDYFVFSLTFGFSTITLDSFVTQGALGSAAREEVFAFSPGLGLVYAFGSAQLGLFTGFDILPGRSAAAREWIYQKQPWLAIGIGFSIYSTTIKD
jgi:hypothetical protein